MKPATTRLSRYLALSCSVASVLASSQPLAETTQLAQARAVYDDAHPSIDYIVNHTRKPWGILSSPRFPPDPNNQYSLAYDGSLRAINIPESFAILPFYGKTVTLLYSKAFNRGLFEVVLDGVPADISPSDVVSAYSDQTLRQVARTYVVGKEPGNHTIQIRSLSGDSVGGVPGGVVDVDAFLVDLEFAPTGTYDNLDPHVTRIGPGFIDEYYRRGACRGTVTRNAETGAAAKRGPSAFSFAFIGDQVTYYYTAGPDRGVAQVLIDGVDKGKVDLWAPFEQRQSFTTFSGLDSRPHVIHISVAPHLRTVPTASTLIDLDRFDVGPRVDYCPSPTLTAAPAEPTAAN